MLTISEVHESHENKASASLQASCMSHYAPMISEGEKRRSSVHIVHISRSNLHRGKKKFRANRGRASQCTLGCMNQGTRAFGETQGSA